MKKEKFKLRDIIKNKQYRAIAILIVYFIVFIFLTTSIRTPVSTENKTNDVSDIEDFLGFEMISNNNFNYSYNIKIGEEEYRYHGKKYKDKELFNVNDNDEEIEYYVEGELTLKRDDEKYILVEKPIYIFDFFDTSLLNKILCDATLNNEEQNIYEINNNKLNKILEESSGSNDEVNYITVFYQNKTITKLVLDFTSYSNYIVNSSSNVIITLEYSDFNLVEDFEVEK